ncbi:MAG: 50S ribosomal protein L15 [Gammaproteobacteria bacterium CG_4_10_14_0_8_um_filter_38_16]|nr:MAG: 50S ribosomal protein L15 [Gammaproteobacteria bacterium CG_4_10_14_0_8_um_filter_38_16]PJA02911.1 MAG: 50S ribosomal protein L15 [Gammaproteobacteria bacterium CG_4_10_14_0_2_um_filter_38_22]PJB11422.1 MAG: 50S ribosomal protein L15 [Gammaproteobacteria bacterium CG_4_9_14_3_um_filter_38_9]
MLLNTIKPAAGAKQARKRLGRGVGSGLGKTAGRGHKGQHARAGLSHKPGFEGGQMPLQRRLPKFGFISRKAMVTAEIRLSELNNLKTDVVDIFSLKEANLISSTIEFVKVFASGEIKKPVTLQGIKVTAGAKKAIEAAGGKVNA